MRCSLFLNFLFFWLETASCIPKKPNKKGTNIKYQYPILALPKSFWSIYHKTSTNLTQNWILMTDYAPGVSIVVCVRARVICKRNQTSSLSLFHVLGNFLCTRCWIGFDLACYVELGTKKSKTELQIFR